MAGTQAAPPHNLVDFEVVQRGDYFWNAAVIFSFTSSDTIGMP
jgi:hypothetical protein